MKKVLLLALVLLSIVIAGCNGGSEELPKVDETTELPEVIEQPIEEPVEEPNTNAVEIVIGRLPDDFNYTQEEFDFEETEPFMKDGYVAGKEKRYEKEIVNTEPIILTGNDVLEIINVSYTMRNSINISDDARLIIKDSLFLHDVDYAMQYELVARGDSQVIFEDSELQTSCLGSVNWNFFDDSILEAENIDMTRCNTWHLFADSSSARIDNWNKFGGTTCDSAWTIIENSKDMELELCYGNSVELDIALPTDIPGKFEFPNSGSSGINSRITIENSTIDGWGIGVSPRSNIIIRDSPRTTISIIVGLPWKNKKIILEGLENKHYADQTWNIADSTLRLINTGTYGWEPNVFAEENTLIIRHSNFTGATLNSDHSTQIIENSTVSDIRSYEFVNIIVENSRITGDVIALDNSNITITNSVIKGIMYGDNPSQFGNVRATGNSRITLINTSVDREIIEEGNGRVIVR